MKYILILFYSLLLLKSMNCYPIKYDYSIPSTPWEEILGNHRTVINIENPGDVVQLNYLWRRHDKNPDSRHLMIINKETGKKIENILRLNVTQEECDILFGPVEKTGIYYFYYLPYEPETKNFWAGQYLVREEGPDSLWINKNRLKDKSNISLNKIPQAKVIEIQARSEFHSFYPMEVTSTQDEIDNYLKENPEQYLVFPEDRSFPIRMLDTPPYKWLQKKPYDYFEGTAYRNEYFALQFGVFASKSSLQDLKIEFSDLISKSGGSIPASSITCFNTHGVDINGNPFNLTVNVAKDRIQPMWIGIDIDKNVKTGLYEGLFTVKAKDQKEQIIKIKLQILNDVLPDRGDSEPWKHSRLRWLNSTIGIDDNPVRPYNNLILNQKEISLLGRNVQLDSFGFPFEVLSNGKEILAEPIKFTIESKNEIINLKPIDFKFTKVENGIISWRVISENNELKLICDGEIEFDGRMHYTCTLTAKENIHLQDVRLEIPYKKEIATYMMGMSRMGGFTPAFHKSRWKKEEDSFWLGNQIGGIHCELRGGSYNGPLLNLYHPYHPSSWFNGQNGGFSIDSNSESVTTSAYSGYRQMQQGDSVKYEFALIITPVKKYDTNNQFNYKYVHSPHPTEEVIANEGNVMNVHHANEYNPFINYPFIANEKLKKLVNEWHEKNWKVKIYYTVRELSNHITEIWALRSLGFEVLADGPGGGNQWLQEHFVDHYTYQWYTHLGNGVVDAAILNSGESRWYNYYLEGLAWLLKEIDIDGLYLDDFSYDRRILKRMRKIMEAIKPGECHIDVHSNTAFSLGPANQYLEIYPYIDRTWYGEGFNFDLMPVDFWFTEISGVPYGVVNELLLHRSVNKGRRGMVYAMVPRGDWGMWQFWKNFGITESKMIGYWENNVPVTTNNSKVYATCYQKDDKVLIVLGSWVSEPVNVNLQINWDLLNLKENKIISYFPNIQNYQEYSTYRLKDPIKMEAKGVKFIIISKK
ncbi:hypothetical protein DSECCO2_117400 [anaerobic digester metagenome]